MWSARAPPASTAFSASRSTFGGFRRRSPGSWRGSWSGSRVDPPAALHHVSPVRERSDRMPSLPPDSMHAPALGVAEQPPTILIVDDSLDGRLALQTLLSNQGYNLAFAGDGVEGLLKAA